MGSLVSFNEVLNFTQKPYVQKPKASPFVKWVGGKRQLISELSKYIPDEIGTYYEPFVGGGAVFFTFSDRINKAILSDTNNDLILTYTAVKKYPYEVLSIKLNEFKTIIVLDGGGYTKGAEQWLKNKAGKNKLLSVFSLGDIQRYASQGRLWYRVVYNPVVFY